MEATPKYVRDALIQTGRWVSTPHVGGAIYRRYKDGFFVADEWHTILHLEEILSKVEAELKTIEGEVDLSCCVSYRKPIDEALARALNAIQGK